MLYADTLKIFESLRGSFDEKEAKSIATAIEQALESNNETILEGVATKVDIADLKAATKEDIANLRAEIKVDIADLRAELIKWMFLFWIGQSAVVLAIVKLVK